MGARQEPDYQKAVDLAREVLSGKKKVLWSAAKTRMLAAALLAAEQELKLTAEIKKQRAAR